MRFNEILPDSFKSKQEKIKQERIKQERIKTDRMYADQHLYSNSTDQNYNIIKSRPQSSNSNQLSSQNNNRVIHQKFNTTQYHRYYTHVKSHFQPQFDDILVVQEKKIVNNFYKPQKLNPRNNTSAKTDEQIQINSDNTQKTNIFYSPTYYLQNFMHDSKAYINDKLLQQCLVQCLQKNTMLVSSGPFYNKKIINIAEVKRNQSEHLTNQIDVSQTIESSEQNNQSPASKNYQIIQQDRALTAQKSFNLQLLNQFEKSKDFQAIGIGYNIGIGQNNENQKKDNSIAPETIQNISQKDKVKQEINKKKQFKMTTDKNDKNKQDENQYLQQIKDKLSQRKFVRPKSSITLNKGKKMLSGLAWELKELGQNTMLKDIDNSINEEAVENECSLSEEVSDNDSWEDYQQEEQKESGKKQVMLLKSIYKGRPPTVFFPYPPVCQQKRDESRVIVLNAEDQNAFELKYKQVSTTSFQVVNYVFEYAGFIRTSSSDWNGFWGKGIIEGLKDMNKYQKSNHFPGCWNLGRKDLLWMKISRMKRRFPDDYKFVPQTYLLGCEWERFVNAMQLKKNNSFWILKPVANACGRGVKLYNRKTKITNKKNYLASEYIKKPHLINGFKYDLRIYVLITSYDPLRIYLYDDGLARFATEKYDMKKSSLKERFVHLTNYSVNKHSKNYEKSTNTDEAKGSKWTLKTLINYFQEMKIQFEPIKKKIKDLIIKTCIAVEPFMLNSINKSPNHRNNCFELYGFDVILDQNLNPWLLECNVCPSLSLSSPLDKKIKTSLLCDVMNLLGFVPYDKKLFNKKKKKTPIPKNEKIQPRLIQNLHDLDAQNCMQKLSGDDWEVLYETTEENYRTGNFTRIFPCDDYEQLMHYQQFFDFPRYNNILVCKSIQHKEEFLEKFYKKLYDNKV